MVPLSESVERGHGGRVRAYQGRFAACILRQRMGSRHAATHQKHGTLPLL